MANLKEIQAQIKSVKGTQKTTRAMKLVSQAKLKRAEELARKSRVYAMKLDELISEIAHEIGSSKVGGSQNRVCDMDIEVRKVDLIMVTSDKGLCGGFNIQTLKQAEKIIKQYQAQNIKVRLRVVGKKAVEYLRFNKIEMADEVVGLSGTPDYKKAAEFINVSIRDFKDGKVDRVVIVHNGFLNLLTQQMRVKQALPIDISSVEVRESASSMELEPSDSEEILDALLKRYFEFGMYYVLLDSLAAEHSARMQAMDNATSNAKERVKELTVAYNKARQESITTELIEIISGMEALK